MTLDSRENTGLSRRGFIKGTGALLAVAGVAPHLAAVSHAGHAGIIKVGLLGCGGRGTGAATNALTVAPQARLVAMCDLFRDQIDSSLKNLLDQPIAKQVTVDDGHKFTGFDGYKQFLDSVDVVLLASSPHYRPEHLEAAVAAGKHVFCEKPVAVDAPGVRRVMETCARAKEKNLNVVSGLCYRYQDAKRDVIQRVHDGAVGEIVALQCTYNAAALWHKGRNPEWSEMEYQNRNWLYFTWLSGDHIAEQSIHSLDKILWAMKDEAPISVVASGGRSSRTQPEFGNVYDHFNTVFEWKSGVRLFHSCRQWAGADTDVSDFVFGSKGTAALQTHAIKGANPWSFKGQPCDMYESEMSELFKALESGKAINDGDYMCKSTMMAIMGRMSAYTGKRLSWDQAIGSQQVLGPSSYTWGDVAVEPIARPGETRFA